MCVVRAWRHIAWFADIAELRRVSGCGSRVLKCAVVNSVERLLIHWNPATTSAAAWNWKSPPACRGYSCCREARYVSI